MLFEQLLIWLVMSPGLLYVELKVSWILCWIRKRFVGGRDRMKIGFAIGIDTQKYFHWKTSARRARNKIRGLVDSNGYWVSEHSDICEIVESYFRNLFCPSMPNQSSLDRVIRYVSPCLSSRKTVVLDVDFMVDESSGRV
ncbi:hypothetical protein Ddye_016924 [Dipteronia dyeriana]|uniref:Uncharacterized protein n=1 Tax=Dipteronia dyeriana TaxID=168575 RepID=A0AAD9U8L2_9ROSI|nr:hypothetical protein Ddye_016924 [Dipteronia dyeriana]